MMRFIAFLYIDLKKERDFSKEYGERSEPTFHFVRVLSNYFSLFAQLCTIVQVVTEGVANLPETATSEETPAANRELQPPSEWLRASRGAGAVATGAGVLQTPSTHCMICEHGRPRNRSMSAK